MLNCVRSTPHARFLFGCFCIKDRPGRERCWRSESSTCISFGALSTQTDVPLSILIRLILLLWFFFDCASFQTAAFLFFFFWFQTLSFCQQHLLFLSESVAPVQRFSVKFPPAGFRPHSFRLLLTSYWRRLGNRHGVSRPHSYSTPVILEGYARFIGFSRFW